MGAAVGTVISIALLMITGLHQVKTQLGMWPFDRRYLKGFVAAGVGAGWLFLWRSVFPTHSFISLGFAFVITAVLFLLTLRILGLDEEEREVLRRVRKRLRRSGV